MRCAIAVAAVHWPMATQLRRSGPICSEHAIASENEGASATASARAELADAIRPQYAAAEPKEQRKILEPFIAATGYHKNSAFRMLNGAPTAKLRQGRQRASLYDEAARAALIVL